MSFSKSRVLGASLAILYFWHYAATPNDWHFIDQVDLIFHEAGHALFMFFGEFTHVLMGSGFQVLLPLGIALYFFFTEQRLSAAICLMWVGANLINVSIYAGDSVVMQLPLLGGDGVIHDWNYLLSTTGLLAHTDTVASIINGAGMLCIAVGSALALYFALRPDEARS